jgi:hypothetical protein
MYRDVERYRDVRVEMQRSGDGEIRRDEKRLRETEERSGL